MTLPNCADMLASPSTSLTQRWPYPVFEDLRNAILDLGHALVVQGLILTEAHLKDGDTKPFVAVIAPEFRVLLHADRLLDGLSCDLQLTFEPDPIAAFLKERRSQVVGQIKLKAQIKQALTLLAQPDHHGSAHEILAQRLFTIMGQAVQPTPTVSTAMTCQPLVDAALQQQVRQEKLLNQVTTQIRQSLELPIILQTAVEKIRECIEADRFLIYQFVAQDPPVDGSEPGTQPPYGFIAYEARANQTITAFVQSEIPEQWAIHPEQYQRACQEDAITSAEIRRRVELRDGNQTASDRGDVLAQLVMPLLVQNHLWGLLIAHQCTQARDWEPREVEFLDHIAEHLAIAIHQAQLYQQLQSQKQTLEEQVAQRTQELRDALGEMQSANRVKSDFLATMSHELRTPLTCVIGMSATLIRWSLGPLNDKQRGYLQTIHDSGEHLLELINDILDLSHVESGKAALNLSEFSLVALVQQTAQMLRDKAEGAQINLKVLLKIPPDRDRFVADLRRVKQILYNLLSNAIKFTPPNGDVTLRAWVEGNTVIFQVEDSGIGIPQSQQPMLFQKFQQLDTSIRRTYEGAGLGLALTKQFVDMHHGWIEVNSAAGQGATFTVELPNQRLLQSGDAMLQLPYSPDNNTRIVLIEDDEEVATLICEMLTAAGYHVVWLLEDSTAIEQIHFLQPALA
ncbi:MAG: ATP-binding protein, partial [Thermosynechococcaceae cyanobacterium]